MPGSRSEQRHGVLVIAYMSFQNVNIVNVHEEEMYGICSRHLGCKLPWALRLSHFLYLCLLVFTCFECFLSPFGPLRFPSAHSAPGRKDSLISLHTWDVVLHLHISRRRSLSSPPPTANHNHAVAGSNAPWAESDFWIRHIWQLLR